jgi:hypothetical protein
VLSNFETGKKPAEWQRCGRTIPLEGTEEVINNLFQSTNLARSRFELHGPFFREPLYMNERATFFMKGCDRSAFLPGSNFAFFLCLAVAPGSGKAGMYG